VPMVTALMSRFSSSRRKSANNAHSRLPPRAAVRTRFCANSALGRSTSDRNAYGSRVDFAIFQQPAEVGKQRAFAAAAAGSGANQVLRELRVGAIDIRSECLWFPR